jgi:tRNA A-37 threonylcarbamoyl transferase component Bud32
MGKVYRAYDPSLKRAVVIKVIALPNLADQEEWQRRFQREVRAAAGLQHPHIVTIYDVDLEGEPLYVVMELLTGGSLKERLRQGPLPWREALKLLRPLVEALAYAHQNGLVHRDVKPANVMFTGEETLPFQRGEGGILKLVDFGLARWRSEEQVTQTGMVIGTPAYMSPEQARGEAVDGQTDIFALGITLFEAIAGYNPLDKGSSIQTLIEATSFVKIDTSSLAGKTPPEVSQLIERAIAREREQRYPSCEALLADLDRCLDDPTATSPTLSRPSRAQRPANGSPEIRAAGDFRLTDEVKAVLRVMFAGFSTVAIETEFGRGFSSSRVFRVRLIETGGRAQLPAVVKIAPIGLIHQEQQAYQNWVEHTLSNIAHLEMSSIFGTRLWGGLRYSLVGGGAFTVESLQDYFHKASLDDLCWVVQNRLFKLLGPQWWLDGRIDRAFQMQSDYDVLLPPNLVIKLTDSPWQGQVQVIEAGDAPALARVTSGEQVQLKGFVVTKIEPEKHYLTLNLPSVLIGQSSASYQIHLGDIPDVSQYQVGHTLDIVEGEVMATRHDLLFGQISETVGQAVDLAAERLILPTPRPVPEPPSLPNPLLNYQRLLLEFVTVTISTIHGDLNMENVLVDPATREVNLIDFATVHQGHNLRDLLQLETDVVIRLIPPALAEAGLPAEIIYPLYEQLHQATIAPHQAALAQLPWPTLEKPFKLLKVIREMARKCLFDLDDWREYYRGLTLYLLGVLKYENLKSSTIAPLPRQVAFWGAATALHFLETPLSHHSAPFEGFVEVQPARAEREDPETRWPIKPPGVPANPKPYDEIEPPYGTMRPSSKFYIERTVDLHCWERLDSTEPVTLFIQAPRQMGKSSLMCRMLEQAKRLQHRRSVFIDFQKFC